MSIYGVIATVLALMLPPAIAILMLRMEKPAEDGVMEITCHVCGKRTPVSEDDPYPDVIAHVRTDEHRRSAKESDA